MIHNLAMLRTAFKSEKEKTKTLEQDIRKQLLILNQEKESKAALLANPHFFRGYIMALHEVLGEGVDTEKYFGIFYGGTEEARKQ